MRRYWLTVLTPVVVCVAIAGVLAFGRTPVYTSQARLTIGSLNIATQGLPGFVYAAQGLSSAYSRVVTANGIVNPVAAKLHMPRTEVIDDLSASPSPNSPIFDVEAKGTSPAKSIQLANVTAKQMQTYIGTFNSISTGAREAEATYRASALTTQTARVAQQAAAKLALQHPSAAHRQAYLEAATSYDVAKGKELAALGIFTQANTGNSGANLVQVIAPANKAKSDRSSRALILLLASLVTGLVIGLALAVTRNYGHRQAALQAE
jgi:capsular polysaccharide biosynthesis protein